MGNILDENIVTLCKAPLQIYINCDAKEWSECIERNCEHYKEELNEKKES